MEFLLECVGFPPSHDFDALRQLVDHEGETVAWRGSPGLHKRLALGGGLDLRIDRADEDKPWTLLPYFQAPQRLRVAIQSVRSLPDSPFDALMHGWAAPPVDPKPGAAPGAYQLCAFLTDAKRLTRPLQVGHVLAISVSGFALDVTYVGPNSGVRDARILERESGAWVHPLGGFDDPGGCAEVSLRVQELTHLSNPITGAGIDLLRVDTPGRPLHLFISPWQLEEDGLPQPRPGWRIEGTFLFTGRIAGGLPKGRLRRNFG